MRARRLVAAVASVTISFAGAVFVTPSGSAASAVTQAAEPEVLQRTGTLSIRTSGEADGPARQLASATVTTTPRQDRVQATVVLKASPSASQNAQLWVVVGERVGNTCDPMIEFSTQTTAAASGWKRSGKAYTLNSTSSSVYEDYDCAFAAVTPPTSIAPEYDRLTGWLNSVYAKPKLTVQTAKLLGANKIKLLRGEWTTVDVTVKNVGQHLASKVVVTGKGKGLNVKKGTYGYSVYPDNDASVPIKVKLTKKGKAKLKLTATGPGAGKSTKMVTIRPAKAPKRIRNGKYRSKDKRVTFRVKKGKITGFRAYAMTTCGGYPDFFTYSWNTYSIPKKKIPRSGIIQIAERGKSPTYTASLNGRAQGKKVKATFRYNGPNRCWASVKFTAKRVGK